MDLWVDFNDMDNKGHVMTLRKFATEDFDLHIGADVLVGDGEGMLCRGVIADLTDQTVGLHLDLGSFHTSDELAMACA